MNKKGVFDQLSAIAIGLVTVAIVFVVVFLILAQLGENSQVIADANASQAVNTTTSAAEDVPDWLPIIIVVIIGALLIGLIAFFRRGART